jgi:hypothetical protein
MVRLPIARTFVEMSYADLPASMGKPCAEFETALAREHGMAG